MSRNNLKYFLALGTIALFVCYCVKPYNPPALQAKNNYLVVDGFINTGANAVTTITLTRTRNLSDSVTDTNPELNASLQIVSDDGSAYPLREQGNGVYATAPLILNDAKTYQLKISTSNGHKYSSVFVTGKRTPPVDSLTWEQPDDLTIYLYTHDPANNSRYYKWDFTETWQYNSALQTVYGVKDMLIFKQDVTNQLDSCWQTEPSTDILLGTSVNLSEDIINKQKITVIPKNNLRIYTRYSILVGQRTITADAYKYWQIVEKNSQDRGGLFDLQPGQLQGNIHSETDPTEPVIGFINASTESEYRIFIKNRQLNNWSSGPHECGTPPIVIPQDPDNFLYYNYADTAYAPYYFVTGGIVLAKKSCLHCTQHGGVNVRPSYW